MRLRIVFICQALDRDDPVLATTVRWVNSLVRKPSVDRVRVLALRTGRYDLPDRVEVHRFGRSGRLATSAAFLHEVMRSLRPRPDLFFVYQGGPYPALLLPFKLLLRIPIVQWKAHSVITRVMAFYARRCDDLLFTATPASFPMDLPSLRVVGHGIDTNFFRNARRPPLGDLIATGRIAPVKQIEQMVRAVVNANRTYGTGYRFNIYGPILEGDGAYARTIDGVIEELAAREWITLHGPVTQERLRDIINGHRVCLNFSTGAIDKSVLEAMACGLPVVSSNDSVGEVIPSDLRPALITEKQSTESQAKSIHELLRRPEAEIAALGQRMRDLVVTKHSLDRLFDRILEDVEPLARRQDR
jgi:glycosyltransferase involved in cell wall biosynthesis